MLLERLGNIVLRVRLGEQCDEIEYLGEICAERDIGGTMCEREFGGKLC